MTIRKRYDRAVGEFIDVVHERAPGMEGTFTADEVLDLFLEFRKTVALSLPRRIQASTPFSRPCYDKPHRCPGWAGGAWIGARVYRCESGYLKQSYRRRYWLGARCPECGLYVLPVVTRWLDPTWIWWTIRRPHWPHWAWRIHPSRLRRIWRNR
jgi:hypothetical protein